MSAPDLAAILSSIPYARFLGVRAELHGDEMTAVLTYSPHLIGNPSLPAIHGGVIGAFMEMTALAQLSIAERLARQPRPVDTFARAHINKVGRRIANVQVEAWQDERARPIAALRGHFILTPLA